jgi:HAMP domain-containing protein
MRLSTRLSIAFALIAAFCTGATLLFVIGGMMMEAQRQVDIEQRQISRMAGELFRTQCASMQSHIAALAGDKTMQIVAEYSEHNLNELLARQKPISHVDHLYVVKRDSMQSSPYVAAEVIGNDFIKPVAEYDRIFTTNQYDQRVRIFEMESGRIGAGVAVQIPSANKNLYWLFGVVELEERVIKAISDFIGLEAKLLDGYPKEYSILRFHYDLMSSKHYASIVELSGCSGEHVAWIQILFPLQPYRDGLWAQIWQTLLAAAFWIAASSLLGIWMARNLAKPIDAIKDAAEHVMAGELNTRVDMDTQVEVEVRKLAEAFNSMTEKIERSVKERETLLVLVGAQLNNSTKTLRHLSGDYGNQ